MPWLQRHRLTRSCGLVEGAMVALDTQIYQVRRSGRRGPGGPGYKDTDLPGPAIWQKGPWLPWVQEQTLPSVYQRRTQAPFRPQALAAKLHMLLITLSRLTAGTSQQQSVTNTASQQHSRVNSTACQQHSLSTTQPVNDTACKQQSQSTTQPVNNIVCQ